MGCAVKACLSAEQTWTFCCHRVSCIGLTELMWCMHAGEGQAEVPE